jgi:DNA-binding GntR family transcriptional regulator
MQESASVSKVERSLSLEEKVYLKLKEAILDCVLPSGAPLIETQQAEKLGVSRTPIRKALARLEDEGFVTAAPTKGYEVTTASLQDIEEIYQLREILECHIVRETAKQFSPEELDEMEAALVTADKALENEDYGGFLESNRTFHHALDRKYGNKRISDLLDNLDEHVYRHLMAEFKAQGTTLLSAAAIRDHKIILDAIRDGDAESAASLMREHLRKYRFPVNLEVR